MTKEGSVTVTKLASYVGAATVILTALFALDGRYVHADEFKKQALEVKGAIEDLHRARLEDEIFRLELVPVAKRSDGERALLDRYKLQLRLLVFKRDKER